MSWPKIIGVMLATAIVSGLVLGSLSDKLGFDPGAGVGAATGIVGALLIAQRRRGPPPPSSPS